MCDTYNCDYLQHNTFRFNLLFFQLDTDLQNHLASHKDRFLKKMLIKRAKTRRLFFTKL